MSQNEGDRKGVLNDSSKIPDRRATSDAPSLPSVVEAALKNKIKKLRKKQLGPTEDCQAQVTLTSAG